MIFKYRKDFFINYLNVANIKYSGYVNKSMAINILLATFPNVPKYVHDDPLSYQQSDNCTDNEGMGTSCFLKMP